MVIWQTSELLSSTFPEDKIIACSAPQPHLFIWINHGDPVRTIIILTTVLNLGIAEEPNTLVEDALILVTTYVPVYVEITGKATGHIHSNSAPSSDCVYTKHLTSYVKWSRELTGDSCQLGCVLMSFFVAAYIPASSSPCSPPKSCWSADTPLL